VAVHIFFLRENPVLLLRRANTGYEDGSYSVVAGHLDGGESVTQAAIREAQEEVGVLLRPADLTVVGVMHRVSNDERVDFFLVATTWDGIPENHEPEKCSELRWCALDALPANTIPYVRTALENFRGGVWFAEFGWHEARP
jgi:8-oxo-dGTP pyrophosphatase MutT (NUDIX family)